ncbi:hypothetical protein WSM22_47710 [Cytophagales bacterium WSM2-2]|nr:hypothetical protein WSM22_47710 [Cytophagales bacterium WSM2-2]
MIVWIAPELHSQDPLFSQFYSAPLFLNPALAGAETNTIVNVNYRTQWNSLQNPYKTAQVSYIYPLILKNSRPRHIGGIGGSVFTQQAGQDYTFKTFGFVGGGAYNLTLDKWGNNFLSFGLQGGVIQKQITMGNFNWGSQYNPFITGFDNSITPTVTNINQIITFPVINAGLTLFHNSKKLQNNLTSFVGFAVSNLNSPNESLIRNSDSRLPFLFKVHGGINVALNERTVLAPQLLWMQQNGINQINVGAYVSYSTSDSNNPFVATAGAWYRVNDSFIALLGFTKSKLTYGFSYDLNTSSLHYSAFGQSTYELSVSYRMPRLKEFRRFSTPLI